MTQAVDLTVAALQESVRHNEKNIDKLDRDLKDFRAEVLKQFEKVDSQFEKVDQRFDKIDQRFDKVNDRIIQLETKVDQRFEKINDRFNQITILLVAIVGLVVALMVNLVLFD